METNETRKGKYSNEEPKFDATRKASEATDFETPLAAHVTKFSHANWE
jgi:hypothetical protein